MKNKKIKCDIYTRVSTTMQVDGYSLDHQALVYCLGMQMQPNQTQQKVMTEDKERKKN